MPTPSFIPGFHGREAELAWLRGLFEEVAETRNPRVIDRLRHGSPSMKRP